MAAAPNPADSPRPPRMATPEQMQAFLKRFQDSAKRMNFLLDEGAAVMIDNSGGGSGGTIFVQGANVAQKVPETLAEAFGGKQSSVGLGQSGGKQNDSADDDGDRRLQSSGQNDRSG